MATNLVSFHGLQVIIETPKGGERSGVSGGTRWTVTMPADYGYIRRTTGADGEQVDCFIGPDRASEQAWIIRQNDLATGEFDEHKVMLGFDTIENAIATYVEAYSDGRGAERIGGVESSTIADLKRALAADQFRRDAAAQLTDHETAEAIRDGKLSSPQRYGDFWLFDLRITGTGVAYRDSIDEYAFRDPAKWLTPEFVERCNGLSVIFKHPDGPGLNHEEWQQRAIGTIVMPYIKGNEVWGVAKIFDADAAVLMQTTHRSTSPGVMPPKDSKPIELADGTRVLDEDLPLVLDHLAVCEAGVWDKNGPPEGVRLDSLAAKEQTVTEEERKALEKARDDASHRADAAEKERDELKEKLDSMMREDARRKDAESEAERERAAEKDRKDGESEEERERAAKKERDDAKRDSRKDRHAKHDGDIMDCSRCDSEEEEERDDKARRDGAPVKNVDANILEELKDSAKKDSRRIADLEAQIASLTKPPSFDDRNAIAAAFHRADALYQKLGQQAPQHMPGEPPIAYRRRLAEGIRKYSPAFKDHAIHDSIVGSAFDHIESVIYQDAEAAAKNPAIHDASGIRAITTTVNGKTETTFVGSIHDALAQFMTPNRRILRKINKPVAYTR